MAIAAEPGELLVAIFSASPDAIVVVDATGKIVLSSPAVTTLFGYNPEELLGESVELLVPVERRAVHEGLRDAFFESPRARTMGAHRRLAGRARDGSELIVEVSLAPVQIRGATYAAAFIRDGRERQQGTDRLDSVNEITRQLLAGRRVRDILPLVAKRARALCRADAVWIVRQTPSDELEIVAVDGPETDQLLGTVLSAESSRSAQVMRSGVVEAIGDLSVASNVPRGVAAIGLGAGLYVPMIADGPPLGTLVLARTSSRAAFEPPEVELAELFARATAVAIELSEVRAHHDALSIVAENERIARDLHDTVLQQLFAVGLALQAVQTTVPHRVGERLEAAMIDLDAIIGNIRTTIFSLPGRSPSVEQFRDQMLDLAETKAKRLGFSPRVGFHGAVDAVLPEDVADQALLVLGEALSNVARHAQASSVEVVVTVEDGWLSLAVLDDGIGIRLAPVAGEGLANMAARAARLGGSSTVSRREPTGTAVQWRVPV